MITRPNYQINDAAEDQLIEEDLERTGDQNGDLDVKAKEKRKRRQKEQLKEQLQSYLKTQDKFAGAMKHILVEHKEKVRQDQRVRNNQNNRTFTPPNQSNKDPNFFLANKNKERRGSGEYDISQIGNKNLLIKGGGPLGMEFDEQNEQEEHMVDEATKGICAGFNL